MNPDCSFSVKFHKIRLLHYISKDTLHICRRKHVIRTQRNTPQRRKRSHWERLKVTRSKEGLEKKREERLEGGVEREGDVVDCSFITHRFVALIWDGVPRRYRYRMLGLLSLPRCQHFVHRLGLREAARSEVTAFMGTPVAQWIKHSLDIFTKVHG